jgi:hypothetical protein
VALGGLDQADLGLSSRGHADMRESARDAFAGGGRGSCQPGDDALDVAQRPALGLDDDASAVPVSASR